MIAGKVTFTNIVTSKTRLSHMTTYRVTLSAANQSPFWKTYEVEADAYDGAVKAAMMEAAVAQPINAAKANVDETAWIVGAVLYKIPENRDNRSIKFIHVDTDPHASFDRRHAVADPNMPDNFSATLEDMTVKVDECVCDSCGKRVVFVRKGPSARRCGGIGPPSSPLKTAQSPCSVRTVSQPSPRSTTDPWSNPATLSMTDLDPRAPVSARRRSDATVVSVSDMWLPCLRDTDLGPSSRSRMRRR